MTNSNKSDNKENKIVELEGSLENQVSEVESPNMDDFSVGDTVIVSLRVFDKQGTKDFRIQKFEGLCIGKKKWNTKAAALTVIKISKPDIIVQKTIPIHSSTFDGLKVKLKGKVRRAKLYYLKERKGNKSMKVKSLIKK